jgi:uncharacterized protein (DUF302 family)
MRTVPMLVSVLAVSLAACSPPPAPTTPAAATVRFSSDASFDDVRDDVQRAILAKGLVIDYTSFIGKMLDRTRKDVGSDKVLYADGDGQAFVFCSAVVSRKTMEADAHNMAFCPYAISVYRTAAEPKKVYVAYRRTLKDVDDLLDGIVRDALRVKEEKK